MGLLNVLALDPERMATLARRYGVTITSTAPKTAPIAKIGPASRPTSKPAAKPAATARPQPRPQAQPTRPVAKPAARRPAAKPKPAAQRPPAATETEIRAIAADHPQLQASARELGTDVTTLRMAVEIRELKRNAALGIVPGDHRATWSASARARELFRTEDRFAGFVNQSGRRGQDWARELRLTLDEEDGVVLPRASATPLPRALDSRVKRGDPAATWKACPPLRDHFGGDRRGFDSFVRHTPNWEAETTALLADLAA